MDQSQFFKRPLGVGLVVGGLSGLSATKQWGPILEPQQRIFEARRTRTMGDGDTHYFDFT